MPDTWNHMEPRVRILAPATPSTIALFLLRGRCTANAIQVSHVRTKLTLDCVYEVQQIVETYSTS